MSNIVPQQRKGHVVWGKLENEHRNVVADASKGIKAVWLISWPLFLNGQAERVIGPDRVGAPHAIYKIIAWQKADGKFTARGYIIKQDDSGSDLAAFLESIDTIEAETALDFFADLDDEAEEELESNSFTTLWVRSDPHCGEPDVSQTEAGRIGVAPGIGRGRRLLVRFTPVSLTSMADVTQIISAIEASDPKAAAELLPVV